MVTRKKIAATCLYPSLTSPTSYVPLDLRCPDLYIWRNYSQVYERAGAFYWENVKQVLAFTRHTKKVPQRKRRYSSATRWSAVVRLYNGRVVFVSGRPLHNNDSIDAFGFTSLRGLYALVGKTLYNQLGYIDEQLDAAEIAYAP